MTTNKNENNSEECPKKQNIYYSVGVNNMIGGVSIGTLDKSRMAFFSDCLISCPLFVFVCFRSTSVGVGNADFTLMEELDGDDVRIANNDGKKASRDIVQFVPMRDFRTKGFHALAREVGQGLVRGQGQATRVGLCGVTRRREAASATR